MPEFVMPIGETGNDFARWRKLDEFAEGFFEAAFFCEANSDYPELESASFADVAESSVAAIVAHLDGWQAANESLLDEAFSGDDYEAVQAGRDYYFTATGSGVGYWSRSELDRDGLGNRLSAAAGNHEFSMYRGDDGRIYFYAFEDVARAA